jgi:hypothetical protein
MWMAQTFLKVFDSDFLYAALRLAEVNCRAASKAQKQKYLRGKPRGMYPQRFKEIFLDRFLNIS